jgi:outer membrane lipoprotein-sorting protein
LALGGIGAVAVVAILLLWLGSAAQPVSAMEQMAENIRKAKSFKAIITMEGPFAAEAGKPPITQKTSGTLYWLAPNSTRWDLKNSYIPKSNVGPSFPEEQTIIFVGHKEIIIDHKEKKFFRQEARTLYRKGLEGEIVEKLGEFSGQADRELGAKDIGGKKARGFEIDLKKLFKQSDGYGPLRGMAEIWIDTESSLPIIVQFKPNTNEATTENAGITQIKNFQWNINLDP